MPDTIVIEQPRIKLTLCALATAMIQADVAKPEKPKAGGAAPAAPQAAAMQSATTKSGTGSSSHARAPPITMSAMCHPARVRPVGGGSSQSAAGMPIAIAAAGMCDSDERRA